MFDRVKTQNEHIKIFINYKEMQEFKKSETRQNYYKKCEMAQTDRNKDNIVI